MKNSLKIFTALVLFLPHPLAVMAQEVNDTEKEDNSPRYISFGARSCTSIFFSNGKRYVGTGAGGQFGAQITPHFNSHYFADWIVSNIDNNAQRIDFHSGFSMMPAVLTPKIKSTPVSIFPLGGICIDYTRFTITTGKNSTGGPRKLDRYSFAVQAGAGATFGVTPRLDFSVQGHYMVHIGTDIDMKLDGDNVTLIRENGTNLEGHFVVAVSMDYKLIKIWNPKK